MSRFFRILVSSVYNPEINIRGNNCCEGERNTNLEEVLVLNLIAFLAENSSTRDVCRRTDGSAVTAKGCAGEKTEHSKKERGRNVVGNLGRGFLLRNRLLFLSEDKCKKNKSRSNGAKLYGKEEVRYSTLPHFYVKYKHNYFVF